MAIINNIKEYHRIVTILNMLYSLFTPNLVILNHS